MQFNGLTAEEVRERISKGLQNRSSKPKTKTLREIFVDNISLGKVYDMIGEINYNEKTNEVNFFATKDKSIYKVTVRF